MSNQNNNNVKKYEVYMRQYDLGVHMDKEMFSKMFGFEVDGVWHTSIEVHEKEYFMGNGIEECVPGTCVRYGPLVNRVLIGETECDPETLIEFIADHKEGMWAPHTYHLLDHNCNHFSDYLATFLTQKGIPSHILEIAEKAKQNPMIKQIYDQNAKHIHRALNSRRK